ncbi:hypothetical protein [Kribbella catacumbae]|uniref:hypothetical protein n=1 Tax=Kribbella catacumbae TaxID=460086 RepID=UPI00037A3E6C|nr:hypothetical protein [Kribbella catacumbae]
MTADAEVAEQNARRAAEYADEAAAAIQRARGSLRFAATVAFEVVKLSVNGRRDVNELILNGKSMAAADEPRRYLADAEYSVGGVSRKAEAGAERLAEVRELLEETRRQLRTGRSAVVQLSRLPGQQSELVNNLQDRLDRLEDAVHSADRMAVEVAGKLAVARGNVEPLARQARDGELQATADTVRTTGTQADRNIHDAQQDLRRLEKNIDRVSPELAGAERESQELEQMLRAAANPTPASQQRAPGSAAEEGTFHLRPGEANRQNEYGR